MRVGIRKLDIRRGVEGEGIEMRIGAATRKLAPGATVEVSV